MGCTAAPEGGPADRFAASYLGSGYRWFRFSPIKIIRNEKCNSKLKD